MQEIKRALVTGGTGVTGNALVRYLLQQNIEVTAFVRPNSFRKKYLPEHSKLTLIECCMDNYGNVDKGLHKGSYDVFFHLAWDGSTGKEKVGNRNNFFMQNQNVTYALEAVELCHRLECPTFVMTGSQAEYGRKSQLVTECMAKCPENGYGMAKLCAEGMTRLLCAEYRIRHIWPILFSVYGPNDATHSLIDTSIRGLIQKETLPYTKGEQLWDYLYSYDVARALLLLAQFGSDGETYNVANGMVLPLSEYIFTMYDVVAPDIEPRIGELPYSDNQVMFLGADITKLQSLTGFVPQYSFVEGVREIVESIRLESIGDDGAK